MENKAIELKDLDLYWNENDVIYGYDKAKNEYRLCSNGELKAVPKGSIDIMWGGCPLKELERNTWKATISKNYVSLS